MFWLTRAIGSEVLPHELVGREDCRAHPVVTIDPDDAKDFDDAICLQRVGRDEWKLWVHIADIVELREAGFRAGRRSARSWQLHPISSVASSPCCRKRLSNELCSTETERGSPHEMCRFLISGRPRFKNEVLSENSDSLQRRFFLLRSAGGFTV